MLEEKYVDIELYINILADRGFEYNKGVAYIMPNIGLDGFDLLSKYSADIGKDLKEYGVNSVVVKGRQYKYIVRRSADIILPLILGIPFAIFANFITDWIRKYVSSDKIVRIEFIKEDKDVYKKIVIEGTGEDVKKILNDLKEH